jgi:hypothetical protein
LVFYYVPSYRYRTEPSDIQNESELQHDLGLVGKATVVPDRFQMRASERFNLTDDPEVVEGGTTLRRDSSFMLNRAELGGLLMFDTRTQLDLRGQHSIKMYDEKSVADENDETSMDGRLLLYREMVSGKLGVMLTGEYQTFDYESSRDLDRGFGSTAGGLGLEMRPGKYLRGTVYAGYMQLDYQDSEMGSASAPYANILIRLAPHDMTEARVTASYMLRNADVYPFASQEETAVGVGLTWRPEVSWTVDAGCDYRHGSYDSDSAPVSSSDPTYVVPAGGDEDRIVLQGSVKYTFASESTSIKLGQTYEDSDSDVSYSFTRNATRLEFNKGF